MDFKGLFSTAGYTEAYREAPLPHTPPDFPQPGLGRNGGLMG